jgi:hypothetical protein
VYHGRRDRADFRIAHHRAQESRPGRTTTIAEVRP